jgi:hypothetical protein
MMEQKYKKNSVDLKDTALEAPPSPSLERPVLVRVETQEELEFKSQMAQKYAQKKRIKNINKNKIK